MFVTSDFLERWETDVKTIHAAAVKNIGKMERIVFRDIRDIYVDALMEMAEPGESREEIEAMVPENGKKLYAVGLKSGEYGAAVILNDGVRQIVAETVGKEYYILPSSVNEAIVISKEEDVTPEELKEAVCGMNAELPPELALTDSIYEYNAVAHEFRQAAEYIEETV